jgi:hypothetical protein
MRKFIFVICSFLILPSIGLSQSKYIGVSLSNNTTGLPIIAYPDVFYTQFHPGLDVTYSQAVNKDAKNRLFVNGTLGYYHHQFVQDLVRIFPSFTYERLLSDRAFLQAGIGGGYGLSFEGKNAFKLLDDGTYERKGFYGARSQYLIALEFGFVYSLFKDSSSQPQLTFQLKSFMQGTYVKSYVPLLPLNSVNLGIRFPLYNKEK